MKRVAALGLVALVFAVGLAAGVLGGRLIHSSSGDEREFRGPVPFQRYFEHRDLDLTAEQQRQVETIFRRQREKFEAVHRELRPRVETLMDETQSAIEEVLTAEQIERYRARRDRWHRRGRHLGDHGGRRDPGLRRDGGRRRGPRAEPADSGEAATEPLPIDAPDDAVDDRPN